MDKRKLMVRIFCLVMAAILVLTAFAGVIGSLFTTQAYAAEADTAISVFSNITVRNYRTSGAEKSVTIGSPYTITFDFEVYDSTILSKTKAHEKYRYEFSKNEFSIVKKNNDDSYLSPWEPNANSVLTVTCNSLSTDLQGNNLSANMSVTLQNVRAGNNRRIEINIPNSEIGLTNIGEFYLPNSLYEKEVDKKTETEGETEGETTYKSATVLESIFVQDKKKKDIEEIDEETDPFTLIVTFLDFGLDRVDFDDIPDRFLSVYLSNAGGFKTKSNLRGEMTRLNASRDGTARFKVEFPNLTFEKGGSRDIEFTVIYEFDNKPHQVKVPATVRQIKLPEDEKDKEKISPLKPYIIADYSWGKEDIVAGTEFTLSISSRNTSTDINLENIVMTITTPETISIASSSNTVHVPRLDAQGTLTHSIRLISKPKAEIGSAEITIDFDYQYVDTVNKKREEGKTTQKIGIPLTQIDRFAVDPITEVADFAMVNEPFYVTVSFINRGNSPTNNISASVKSKKEFTAASQHFGNLDSGKSDSVELAITPQDDGEFVGEIVISYEDENTNQKEINKDFSVFVQEPYVPDPNEGMIDREEEKTPSPLSTTTIVLSVIGSLFIAGPVGFYYAKRSKSKESGAFDEDF